MPEKTINLRKNKEYLEKLDSERFRTGFSSGKLIKSVENIPPTLNAKRIQNILEGRVAHPLKTEYDFLIWAYSRIPDAPKTIELSPLKRKRLREAIEEKGLQLKIVARGVPAHLNLTGNIIGQWMRGEIKGVNKEQYEAAKSFIANYVPVKKFKIYEEDTKIDLDDPLRKEIRQAIKDTGMRTKSIFSGREDLPDGFNASILAIMCSHKGTSTKRVKKEYVEYVFKVCKAFCRS